MIFPFQIWERFRRGAMMKCSNTIGNDGKHASCMGGAMAWPRPFHTRGFPALKGKNHYRSTTKEIAAFEREISS
jgi:hypothetical protein